LGKSETTIHRWLFQYKEGGIENLLKNRQIFGRPKKFSVEVVAAFPG
jgi:transposase